MNDSQASSGSNVKMTSKEKNKQDLQLLNDVWKVVTKFTDPIVIYVPFYV